MDDVGKPNVLISTKIAHDYPNADGSPKKVGDSILIGGKKFEVIGLYETGSLLIDTTVVMDIETARELLNVDKNSVSAFYVEPQPLVDLSDLGERITGALDDVQIRTMSQFNIQVGDIMGKLELFLSLTVGLALLVGGVGIANTMLMSAMERIVEFGVMRANGWTRRNILSLVTVESALLGLLSGILAQHPGLRGSDGAQPVSDPVRAPARAHARVDRRQQSDGPPDRGRRRAFTPPGALRA